MRGRAIQRDTREMSATDRCAIMVLSARSQTRRVAPMRLVRRSFACTLLEMLTGVKPRL